MSLFLLLRCRIEGGMQDCKGSAGGKKLVIFLWWGMGIIDFFMREEGHKTVEIRQTMQAKHGNSQVFFEFLFLSTLSETV